MIEGLFSRAAPLSGFLARVVLERGIDQPEGLTYAVPESLRGLEVGDRVRAPLGRGDRPVEGYVIEVVDAANASRVLEGLDPARVKPLIGLAASPAGAAGVKFPASLVRLAVWISQYYCCPIGMVLAGMIPSAVKRQTGIVVRRTLERIEGPAPKDLPPSIERVYEALRLLEAGEFPMAAKALADRLGQRNLTHVNRLIRAGVLRELARAEVRADSGSEWETIAEADRVLKTLNAAQARALEGVGASLGRFQGHLLFGVTGSGKTEVYLQALARAIHAGGSAIVLVPEISLTPQTAGRFLARFQEEGVAILHSGLSASQRHREWVRVATGQARVVVGARSAVFAPSPTGSLRMIIVDEEHDSSYKQDQLPRYHARDAAVRRAQLENCPVVLGSATPSLESWRNARGGRFSLWELPERVGGGSLPPVRVVDMFEENRGRPAEERRHLRSLGPTLEGEIAKTLAGPGQIILLLNRRGFASYVCCASAACGWYLTCKHCDVTAVYHKGRAAEGGSEPRAGVVRCHHCLSEQKLPAACPACGQKVNTFGFGTQRVEDEIQRLFPSLRLGETLLRLDSDSMQRASDYFEALGRFKSGEVRALLGTQMIAKGLDFPNVELIGIINADTGLNLPDFRAEERTFQLVSQVAGRAGRGAVSGRSARVIVQSFSPGAPAIQFAARHDYKGFAERESGIREESGLPPFGRMARIVCRDEDAAAAEARAREIAEMVRGDAAGREVRVRGPMACPIARIAGFHRFAVEFMAASAGPIQQTLAMLRTRSKVKSDAKTAVDVDPISLL